jgi:hypothetical protein
MSWTLLKSTEDWTEYQKRTAKTLRVSPTNVDWGSPPESYPCLVSTLFPPRPAGSQPRAYSAFVYESDAEEVMTAAGRKMLDADMPLPPTQAQYNRWMAAQMLTIVHYMVETGICKKEQYEDKLLESIELVDTYSRDKREEFKSKLTPSQVTVLDTLLPPQS